MLRTALHSVFWVHAGVVLIASTACSDPCEDDGFLQDAPGACADDESSSGRMDGSTSISTSAGETGVSASAGGTTSGGGTTAATSPASSSESGGSTAGDTEVFTCRDGIQNGNETDVDCGHECGGCELGDGCDVGDDCTSGYCDPNAQTCAVPPDRCVVGYLGGAPARVSVVHLEQGGQLDIGTTMELSGDHSPGQFEERTEGVAVCGRQVYFALSDDESIAGYTLQVDGTLELIGVTEDVEDVQGVLCDEGAGVLFAFGATNDGDARVVAFDVGEAGELSALSEETFAFPFPIDLFEPRIHAALHPSLGILYLAAGTEEDDFLFEFNLSVARVVYDDTGITAADMPVLVGFDSYFTGLDVSDDGSVFFVPGFGGGCSGYHALSADGSIPPADDFFVTCGPSVSNTRGYALRQDGRYIISHAGGGIERLTFGEFNSGMQPGGNLPTMTYPAHLQLAYDDSILVVLGQSGAVDSYLVAPAGDELTAVDTATIEGANTFQASIVLPCDVE